MVSATESERMAFAMGAFMIWYLHAAFWQLILPALVGATTVITLRTATDIYIGADSKIASMHLDGSVSYGQQCKIGQVGSIFFAGAGAYGRKPMPSEDPNSRLDIRSSLIKARALGGTMHQIIARFSDVYADEILRTLEIVRSSSPKQYEKASTSSVYVYFFGFEGDTPVSLRRTFTPMRSDAAVTTIRITEYDCPPNCAEPHAIGVGYGNIIKDFSADVLKTRSPTDVIREIVELSIKEDPEQKSGMPVDILHLTKHGASWIQKKKECPEIKPY
jgi:hypothetical protein